MPFPKKKVLSAKAKIAVDLKDFLEFFITGVLITPLIQL